MRALAVFIALAVFGACYVLEQRLDLIERRVNILIEEERPMTFTWNTAGADGSVTEVVLNVPKDPGWTIDQWKVEARDQLTAMQAEFPPIP